MLMNSNTLILCWEIRMKVKIDPRRKKKGPKLKIMLAPIEDGQGTKSAISSTRVCRCMRLDKYAA